MMTLSIICTMIEVNGYTVTGIFRGSRAVSAVYKGAVLVWEALSSVWRGAERWASSQKW